MAFLCAHVLRPVPAGVGGRWRHPGRGASRACDGLRGRPLRDRGWKKTGRRKGNQWPSFDSHTDSCSLKARTPQQQAVPTAPALLPQAPPSTTTSTWRKKARRAGGHLSRTPISPAPSKPCSRKGDQPPTSPSRVTIIMIHSLSLSERSSSRRGNRFIWVKCAAGVTSSGCVETSNERVCLLDWRMRGVCLYRERESSHHASLPSSSSTPHTDWHAISTLAACPWTATPPGRHPDINTPSFTSGLLLSTISSVAIIQEDWGGGRGGWGRWEKKKRKEEKERKEKEQEKRKKKKRERKVIVPSQF